MLVRHYHWKALHTLITDPTHVCQSTRPGPGTKQMGLSEGSLGFRIERPK
jgi:hypothetical protein